MRDALFIGIDGGGTNCRARLRNGAGERLGEGRGGPANVRLGSDVVMESILTATRAALAEAGLPETMLGRLHAGLGLAGAGLTTDRERLRAAAETVFASVAIDTDAVAAWWGACGGADGAILILGTGSCGLAVVGGKRTYVGGWGPEISDEGSGAVLGQAALRRAARAAEGLAPATPLTAALLARFDGSLETIVGWTSTARPTDYGSFVPLVFEHAERLDRAALDLLGKTAAEVAEMVLRLLDLGAPRVRLIGGLSGPLEGWLPPPIRAYLAPAEADAVDGAILMARAAFV